MNNIKITMLGATGVGKTSLMAALYHCSNTILSATKLNFSLGLDTKKRLESRLQRLRELSDNNCFKAVLGIQPFNLPSKKFDDQIFSNRFHISQYS